MTSVVDKKLSECFTEFTLDVYKNLARKDGSQNLFMSHSSISVVMTMVHAGARGNTESQMRKTLKLEKLEEKGFLASFEGFVRSIKEESNNFTLTMANKLYPNVDKTILDSYVSTVTKHFLAETKPVDFTNNPEGSRIEMNKWVEDETKNKIKDLWMITSLTALVVINAIYLKVTGRTNSTKGRRRNSLSTPRRFKLNDMMFKNFKKTAKYGRIDLLDCSALELPYKGGRTQYANFAA